MVDLLLMQGADINIPCYSNLYCTFETPVIAAARLQNVRLLQILLQHGELKDETESRVGKTALQWAATYGDIDMAALMLSHGCDINWIGPYFHTALHYAATSDQTDMVKFLLDHGAEVNMNGDGRTPLHTAAVRGNMLMLHHFVSRHTDVNLKDIYQFSAFTLACLRGHLAVLQYFMENCNTRPDLNDGLLKAAESGHGMVITFLLEQGADVNYRDVAGATALIIASRGQFQVVKLLLENNACHGIVDNRGFTALQCALQREQYEIAKLLIINGAYLNKSTVKVCSKDGILSPLELAFRCPDLAIAKWIVQAGCCLLKERWLTVEMIQQCQDSIEENNNIHHFRYQTDLDKQMDICSWFLRRLQIPCSLSELCRARIRWNLSEANGHTSILKSITDLPLPQSLKNFLALSELHDESLLVTLH